MQKIPVIILGAGGVGRALLRQLIHGRANTLQRNHLHFDILAVADSRRWLWDAGGLDDATLAELLARKQRREPLGEARPDVPAMIDAALAAGHTRAILVDVTAQDGMEPALNHALAHGFGVVLANKKPLAGDWATAQPFFNNPAVRHESTVGGGQPVIATLRYLNDTHDTPQRIMGQLSGTLGYICRRLDEGIAFSQALAEAKGKGYTEPDPREDLGGLDVMRKVLILARMCGWPLEAADIRVEALYSSALAHLGVPEFMAAAVALDASMQARIARAHADGQVLRYLAQVTPTGGSVGLTPVAAGSALADLKYISFQTPLYDDEPLMIVGKGAGVEMTAAGVVGDLIGLARELF